MSTRRYTNHVSFTRPLELTLRPGAEVLSPDDPPSRGQPVVVSPEALGHGSPLTVWLRERPIGSRLFTPRQARALQRSLLFSQPISLALDSSFSAVPAAPLPPHNRHREPA